VQDFPFDSATYAVMVTRGHLSDLECVRAVLTRTYRYAGFIGSERKARLLREQLARDGFAQEKIDSLHAPIGLAIKAETPAELAVAILAELVAVRRNAEIRVVSTLPPVPRH
jgi:xanthine dehydrogenase accessory factor